MEKAERECKGKSKIKLLNFYRKAKAKSELRIWIAKYICLENYTSVSLFHLLLFGKLPQELLSFTRTCQTKKLL